MMFDVIKPTGILKKYIQNYCIVEVENSLDFLPLERVYPTGNIALIFHYGSPSKFKKRNSAAYDEPNFVICGQQTSYYDLSLAGKTGMVFVEFKANGLKPFFPFSISELLNQNISFCDLLRDEARQIEDQLFQANNNIQRIALIENFLFKRLTFNKDAERIEHTIKIINEKKGQVQTQLLAKEACLGIKQFERVFSDHVGLKPKKYQSIVRFQNVIKSSKNSVKQELYQIAFDNGYYDQSHFIHDFKSITGVTPGAFFRNQE